MIVKHIKSNHSGLFLVINLVLMPPYQTQQEFKNDN